MPPRRKADPPCFGCKFCPSRSKAADRCGQHLDEQLPEYCAAHNKPAPNTFFDPHPTAAIRAWRANVDRRASPSCPAVVLLPQTVREPVGAGWNFIVPLETNEDIRLFVIRTPKTAEQWLDHLGAIPLATSLPPPASPIELSSDEASSSDYVRDDLTSPIPKHHTRGASTHITLDSRNSGNTVTSNRVRVGKITGEKLAVASGTSSITSLPDKTADSDADDDDDDDLDDLRARWGVARTPLSSKSIQHMLKPTPVGANGDAFFERVFTPGKGPTYFKFQIATTEFYVNIKKATTLTELIGIVQRDLLDKEGWPSALGLAGVDGVLWDEGKWEKVKMEGKLRNVVVVGEVVFDL